MRGTVAQVPEISDDNSRKPLAPYRLNRKLRSRAEKAGEGSLAKAYNYNQILIN